MDITEEEDEKWHRGHDLPQEAQNESRLDQINPFAVGGGFLAYCVKQGWLIQEGKDRNARYYVTRKGREELRKFSIEI